MVDLKDTTIVIPLRIDSPQRERNLDIVLAWFCRETNANILLLEADSVPRYQIKADTGRITYFFIEDTDYVFYHTRYRNELIKKADTPIVGVWDTDIIIPANQMEQAVMFIRKGIAKIASPYNGSSGSLHNEPVERFKEKMDISILFNNMRNPLPGSERATVGGAFFVDKDVYLKAGGENENCYGWGPEDAERIKRMEILGYPLYQAEGPRFHLWHPRGINSGVGGNELQRQNKKEFIKICGMYKPELEKYIATWGREPD